MNPDDPRLAAIRERFEREIADWGGPVLGEPLTPGAAIRVTADAFHRRGVPVTNGRVVGDQIVFDVVAPRGVG